MQPVQSSNQMHTSKITIPINNLTSSSSSSVTTSAHTANAINKGAAINTEEFAKLDALLEDLLAEVEQPILLNKYNESLSNKENLSAVSHSNSRNVISNSTSNNTSDDVERSVDWLNEQKERLRSRKELNPKQSVSKVSDTNLSYTNFNGNSENSFRKLQPNNFKSSQVNYTGNSILTKSTPLFSYEQGSLLNDSERKEEAANQTLNGALNGYMISNNRLPSSPTATRRVYSPIQQQPAQQQQQQPFRSLSTNPTLLRNINETDDEINMIESEFDRYNQRSFRGKTGTTQRSKYHTVSNDFVDCTKAPSTTPVPSSTYTARPTHPGKRALSAPPVELGKVVLQRMELKSPVTVRQGSVVPFENQQQMIQHSYNNNNDQQLVPQQQQSLSSMNQYNQHGIQKSQNQNMIQYQTQPRQVPPRNVFLNRSFNEQPRIGYTNGYETDSGISNGYNTYRGPQKTGQIYSRNGEQFYNQPRKNIGNGFSTIGGQSTRNYMGNDQNGYETDSGLIKLRQALDNRRALSRNDLPIQHQQQQQQIVPNGYYYQGRSITPSFNYNYNQQQQTQQIQQPTYRSNQQQYNTHLNNSLQEPHFMMNTYSNDAVNLDMLNDVHYVDNEEQFSTMPQFQQYTNNGVIEILNGDGNPTYLSEDGRQVTANEFEAENIQNNYNANLDRQREYLNGQHQMSQSMVVHQQRAPSAYSVRDTPSRLACTSSATNISVQPPQSYLNGQLSGSQQIVKENKIENPRRSSATSLATADGSEILRNHPKSVKTSQNFWYKAKISRDEAINLLKDKQPGTFLIRDSNNFPGAYGLALKVDKAPSNVQIKPGTDPLNELVRHFLIEPTAKGVRIKGCYNEPIFASLAALVYQHSLTPLALPIKLNLPQQDLTLTCMNNNSNDIKNSSVAPVATSSSKHSSQDARHLLEKGAACQVYYLNTVNIENKHGLEAISQALSGNKNYLSKDASQLILTQFKVTSQGITLTDINKKKFLRQHFPTNTVLYCAIEEKLTWQSKIDKIPKPRIFGVITKPSANLTTNECHLFVEMDQDQPAIAIVDFINRYLIPSKVKKS